MQFHIREAKKSDLSSVYPLVVDFASSFAVEKKAFKCTFKQLISDSKALLLVAEKDARLIGYCLGFLHNTFYANGKVAWLEEIMVTRECRRKGAGQLLMQHFEKWAKNEGAVLSALATRRASSFYNAIGYEESATYFRKVL